MRLKLIVCLLFLTNLVFSQSFFLVVGTYTDSGSKGIYVYDFNTKNGTTKLVFNTDSASNPSYLTISADHKNIYAVNETNHATPGRVSAYTFNNQTGTLQFINQQQSGGDDPCYISVTKNKKWAIVANYSGGSVAVLPIAPDGSLNHYAQLIQDNGKSINTSRQEKAHVHAAVLSPDEYYLFTPDLGTDKLMEYHFNQNNSHPLTPANPTFIKSAPGSGPRHFTFSPDHKHAYLIQELSGSIAAFNYHNGHLSLIQNTITHPGDFKGDIGSADIHISPDGRFLYASNRGQENTITIFSINKVSGKLSLKGYNTCGGTTPRNFMIDPTGNYLLVANQNSNNIVIFQRDKSTGLLTDTHQDITIQKPVCLQMTKHVSK